MKCTECGGAAKLFKHPEEYAGIWECLACGASDNHEHDRVTMEYDDGYYIWTCDDCLVVTKEESARQLKHEAYVDMLIGLNREG